MAMDQPSRAGWRDGGRRLMARADLTEWMRTEPHEVEPGEIGLLGGRRHGRMFGARFGLLGKRLSRGLYRFTRRDGGTLMTSTFQVVGRHPRIPVSLYVDMDIGVSIVVHVVREVPGWALSAFGITGWPEKSIRPIDADFYL